MPNPATTTTPATSMPPRLAKAQAIVNDAAEVALAAFRSRSLLSMRAKAAQDFVSAADETVERLIRARLRDEFPEEAVLGEEGGLQSGAEDKGCWFVDPIDGTTNFLRGVPLWGVSLGWVCRGQARAGVVALPALGMVVAAQVGGGLFLGGQAVARQVPFEEVHLVSIGDANLDLEASLALTHGLRCAGWMVESYRSTCVGLAFSALGLLDGHLQRRVHTWDIAGGLALCAEAGLEVRHGPLGPGPTWAAAATPELAAQCRNLWPEAAGPARGSAAPA